MHKKRTSKPQLNSGLPCRNISFDWRGRSLALPETSPSKNSREGELPGEAHFERFLLRACHELWLAICRRGFWRSPRRERSGNIRMDLARANNVGDRQKPPGPEGWVENGLAAALRLAFSPIRGCALAAPCQQPFLTQQIASQSS